MRNHAKCPLVLLLLCVTSVSQALSPVRASLVRNSAALTPPMEAGAPSFVGAQRIIIEPGNGDSTTLQDTTISSWAPDASYGNDPQLKVRPGDGVEIINTLLRWNLDMIPAGSAVQSASLEMYCTQGIGSQIEMSIFQVLRPWQEASSTWKKAYTGTGWGAAGCQAPGVDRAAVAGAVVKLEPSTGWFSWDITTLVQAWVDEPAANYGMILVPTQYRPQTEYAFGSSEGYFSVRPRLVIEYGPAVATNTPTLSPSPSPSPTLQTTPTYTPTLTASPSPTDSVKGAIQGLVYEDRDGDSEYDEGEPGLSGVLVTVKDSTGRQVDFTNTATDGAFLFSSLVSDTYRVEQYDLPGTSSTTPNLVYIPLEAGDLLWVSFGDRYASTPTATPDATESLYTNYLPILSRHLVFPLDEPTSTATPLSASYAQAVNCGSGQGYRASDDF